MMLDDDLAMELARLQVLADLMDRAGTMTMLALDTFLKTYDEKDEQTFKVSLALQQLIAAQAESDSATFH